MNVEANNLSESRQDLHESLYRPGGLKGFMQGEGFFTSRSLGQNFLINERLMDSVLNACKFPREGTVIEIGPGIGHLTWILIERGLRVVAVEKDDMFANRLPDWQKRWGFEESALSIIHQDALETDFKEIAEKNSAKHAIGNLPYNVSVPILFHLAYCGYRFDSICVMVQREVGERIMAEEGNKTYGRLSIVLKYLFNIKRVMAIRPGAFFPKPKIDSVFMKFVPKPEADVEFAHQFLERAAHIGFLHRRKKMRKNLQGGLIQKRVLRDLVPEIEKEFDLDSRAEDWPVDEWVRFAKFIQDCPPAE